jgi:hypothetical protein
VAALINHSCEPNAVIVFPFAGRVPDPIRVVAIKPIKANEEVRYLSRPAVTKPLHHSYWLRCTPKVLTSYIDLALPRRLRQSELLERYHFVCDCPLCTRPLKDPAWIDPREAVNCQSPGCGGLARIPGPVASPRISPFSELTDIIYIYITQTFRRLEKQSCRATITRRLTSSRSTFPRSPTPSHKQKS